MSHQKPSAEFSIPRRAFLRYCAAAGLATTAFPELLLAEAAKSPEPIDRTRLEACESLAGLSFTEKERDLMLADLETLRQGYEAVRALKLPHHVPPALVFQPAGEPAPEPEAPSPTLPPPEGPFSEEDLPFLSIRQQAARLRRGETTSVELTRTYLDRLSTHGETLECVVRRTTERALQAAERTDRELARGHDRGPLHGLPWGAKDLMAARGYPTTWGATPFQEQHFDYDAAVVERLERAGAVLTAKLTSGALAWGDVWFGGTTRNPWKPEQGSSGSSAGSAAATAAGLVAFSLGTETLGSIVSPSTRCGATGLRPTFGRVSRHGVMPLAWTLDKIGPLTRSVEDCALVFEALAGTDPRDPSTTGGPFHWRPDLDPTTLRLGYLPAAFDQPRLVGPEQIEDSEWPAMDRQTLETLGRLGFDPIPLELPELPLAPLLLTISVEAAAVFDELTRSDQDDELVRQQRFAWPNIFRQARLVPAVEYLQAQRARTLWMQAMAELFEKVDVYVAPSLSSSLTITNLTGHPSLTLPNGFREDGTPTSITFTGRLFGENALLSVAGAYQRATGFHKKRPRFV